jgi:glucosamine--fructose-6-phosphate aminotransferase (isomerizing)
VASDPSAIVAHTHQVVFLEDGDIVVLTPDGYAIENARGSAERMTQTIEWDVSDAQKGGYEHFMLKEIMEEPDAVLNTMRGRISPAEGTVKLGGLESVAERLKDIKRIIIVACGTASYAGYVGEYMLEEHAGIPVEVEVASEFRYRHPVIDPQTAVLAISQSGETADTLEAVREGKRRGALTLGIVNAVGSTIARETDAGVYNHAGPEISVASTKAFLSQLTALALLTVMLGRQRGMTEDTARAITMGLGELPARIAAVLKQAEAIKTIATKYADKRDFFFIGRTYCMPVAFEGALKLKECSYIHAEGCGAGEMKHGHIALIDKDFPTIAIAPDTLVYEKVASNIQEIKARGGPVIAIATEGNTDIAQLADDVIYIPPTLEMLTPILAVVPLHLLAYYIASGKGLNVDRPRNLAKSVTVE